MELSAKQHATVVKMAKAGKFFPEIAKVLKIKAANLYQLYPGGARVLAGKAPYAARGSKPTPAPKRPAKKAKKSKAKKPAATDW